MRTLTERIRKGVSEISDRSPLRELKDMEITHLVHTAVTVTFLHCRTPRNGAPILMSQVITAIGKKVRKGKAPDTSIAAKIGAFLLWWLEDYGCIVVSKKPAANGHAAMTVDVVDEDKLSRLWAAIPKEKIEKLPSVTPYAPWVSFVHETGKRLVKTSDKEVAAALTPEACPIAFEVVNIAQNVGWRINKQLLDVANWAFRNRQAAFDSIWSQPAQQSRVSKSREASAILSIAERFKGTEFYHLYYLDFRGRKYPATAYLHEQGSDLAKGLLLRADKKPLGSAGWKWLLISLANNWAGSSNTPGVKTDKLPLSSRVEWTLENEDWILESANSPRTCKAWMEADNPWQFLAAAKEMMAARVWQINTGHTDPYGYESSCEGYIDGSNNGSQHLAALTLDEVVAEHVNLLPSDVAGDLYAFVADKVWERIEGEVACLSAEKYLRCRGIVEEVSELKTAISQSPKGSPLRNDMVLRLKALREVNEEDWDVCAKVFWSFIRDPRERRKVVKRNVMTLPYGGTPYGLGQQQVDDAAKHGIPLLLTMEHKWGSAMGRLVFDTCKDSMGKPMQLLSLFERCGKAAEARGAFLRWKVPVTGLPVVQHYTQGVVKKLWIQYGPPQGERKSTGYYENTYQMSICFSEISEPQKGKQQQGAAPNAIHSLDAAHLMMTCSAAKAAGVIVTTIHDSFGGLYADMDVVYSEVRKQFVKLYATDPLSILLLHMGCEEKVLKGSLDLNLVLNSQFCFS